MPSKEDEPRRRKKDYDRNRDSAKHRDKDRHRSSRSSRTTRKASPTEHDRERDEDVDRRRDRADRDSSTLERSSTSNSHTRSRRRPAVSLPEMERRASVSSPGASKTSLPYPSFSKAHSKEAVNPRVDIYTPDPTDLGRDRQGKDGAAAPATVHRCDPPSPPLTNVEAPTRVGSANSTRAREEGKKAEFQQREGPLDTGQKNEIGSRFSTSKSSLHHAAAVDEVSDISSPSRSSDSRSASPGTQPRPAKAQNQPSSQGSRPSTRSVSGSSSQPSTVTEAATESDATSIAPNQPPASSPSKPSFIRNATPAQRQTSLPREPSPKASASPSFQGSDNQNPPIEIFVDEASQLESTAPPPPVHASPLPPPPPPPVMMPPEIPRVDYLLQNGGLPRLVSRSLLRSQAVGRVPLYQQYTSPQISGPPTAEVDRLFAPLQGLLDDYAAVISNNGSIAVATGYRSVARRLLDRLEHVFIRNISSETCRCIICQSSLHAAVSDDEETGLSWGEILEFVSGRRELPPWPPFSITADPNGLGISSTETKVPMQKLDIDVPEEYREHYFRQSQKTKAVVQSWLARQPEFPSSPPQEVDDDTLTFAMLTHLDPEQQRLFTALLRGMTFVPGSRVATPLDKAKSDLMSKTALALQRLYRLQSVPRDPECTMYLIKNPSLHNILATLAAIKPGEWEILISGRFDGFLWSGAESSYPTANDPSTFGSPAASRGPSRGPTATPLSRTTTPFSGNGIASYSRGNTPFTPFPPSRPATTSGQAPGPVQMDEETEIAVLAEVEREIYLGMEALENAFEALHVKAEAIRRSLRERGAGLALAAQARRGSNAEGVEVRMGTPASASGWNSNGWNGANGAEAWEGSVTDDWIDERSELAPDDSASNVSWRRRPKRRHERRTPAPVEEEGSEYGSTVTGR